MCEPVSIGALSLSAAQTFTAGTALASAGATLYGQNQQARANTRAARKSAQAQATEQRAASAAELGVRMRERNRRLGLARVAAGEAGVGGQSYAMGLQQIMGEFNTDAAMIEQNASFARTATQRRLDSVAARNRGPNPLSAGLRIAEAGLTGISQGAAVDQALAGLRVPTPRPTRK